MKQQVTHLSIALIVCCTTLYLFGAFDNRNAEFATAYYEGGFKKLGELSEQSAFSDIQIFLGNQEVYAGSAEEMIDILQAALKNEDSPATAQWKNDFRIKGKFGVHWTGSENTFELTTDKLDIQATKAAPLNMQQVIDTLTAMNTRLKTNLPTYAQQTLRFNSSTKDAPHL